MEVLSKMIGENELWPALLVFLILTLTALFVSILMWKLLPQSNQASYEGKKWKLGGAFAAFILVLYGGMEMVFNINNELVKREWEKIDSVEKIEIIEPPIEFERYESLFADLDKSSEFFAYNAPFKLEETESGSYKEKSVKAHIKRYKEDGIKSQYLFFYKTSYKRADEFFTYVKKGLDEKLHSNIRYKTNFYMESDKKPCHAFFLATKNNKKVVIYYPDPYRDGQDGMPNVVIKVTDADKLYQKFKERFWKDYDNADAVKRQTEQNEELMRKKLKGM